MGLKEIFQNKKMLKIGAIVGGSLLAVGLVVYFVNFF